MRTYKEFVAILEAGQWTGQANFRYGSTPATATNKSVSSAVDRALANPGTSQSASQTTGRTGVTGSANISYVGSRGPAQKPTPKPTPTVASKPTKPQPTSSLKPGTAAKFTTKNYTHADSKVNARLQSNPKLLNRAVELANKAAASGGKAQEISSFYNNAVVNGKPVNAMQSKMTQQSRELNPTGVSGVSYRNLSARSATDREAFKGLQKQF